MILEYRNTPTAELQSSPVQSFFGRRTRTTLPVKSDLLNYSIEGDKMKELIQRRQDVQKQYYDQHTAELPELAPGEVVRIQPYEDLMRIRTLEEGESRS